MVEPIEIALNKIPDHDNLTKVNGAIDKDFNILYIDDPAVQNYIRENIFNYKKDW